MNAYFYIHILREVYFVKWFYLRLKACRGH